MTDIERRALLGDRQAQEECTMNGIVLPCPFCGGKAEEASIKRKKLSAPPIEEAKEIAFAKQTSIPRDQWQDAAEVME